MAAAVFEEEFCEAVVVPKVKIAFGAIRRWQTPWALTTGLFHNFLALLLFSLLLTPYQNSPDRRSGSPASPFICFAAAALHIPVLFCRGDGG